MSPGAPSSPAAPRPRSGDRRAAGFTLPEILVVVVILGSILLLVPANLHMFGARTRLESTANDLASAVALAREQAILDGHPVYLEIGEPGYRMRFTSLPAERSELLQDDGSDRNRRRERPDEREWLTTDWFTLPEGVLFAGYSEEKDDWRKLREDEVYGVAFHPDGTVEKGFAVRVESDDLEVKRENRTYTVRVNGLTASASVSEGLAELPPQREDSEFAR